MNSYLAAVYTCIVEPGATPAHSPSAVCSPPRYAILTGRYCWRTSLKSGVLWTDDPLLMRGISI